MKITLTTAEIKDIVGNFYQINNFQLEIVCDEKDTKSYVDNRKDSFECMIARSGIEKGSTIPLIKAIRQVTGLSLKDSKDIKDEFERHLTSANRYNIFNHILLSKGINLNYFYEGMDKYAW